MLTITELSADLNCSRTTLYRIIDKLDIEPHKAKRKSLLDDHQVAQIRKSLQTPHNRTSTGKPVQLELGTATNDHSIEQQLIEQLRSETRRLERLLDHEQRQRTDERTERERERQSERERGERQDAMIAGLLAEQKVLRDEVKQLKALQEPKNTSTPDYEHSERPSRQDHFPGNTKRWEEKKEDTTDDLEDAGLMSTSTFTSTSGERPTEHQSERQLNVTGQSPIRQRVRSFGQWLSRF
jgi:hypothetical protein